MSIQRRAEAIREILFSPDGNLLAARTTRGLQLLDGAQDGDTLNPVRRHAVLSLSVVSDFLMPSAKNTYHWAAAGIGGRPHPYFQLRAMKPDDLKKLVDGKRRWIEPLTPKDRAKGFKGWYSSKYLPHFDSPGAQQYLTYRLADSLPAERRGEWEAILAVEDELEKQRTLEHYLDLGHGACHLRNPRIAELVQRAFWHYDGVRYQLLAWVIMPNHIHALIEVWQTPLGKILKDLKGYTAKEANKILGRDGTFWEDDYFDRYIRDEEHFRRVVAYIENNPVKAALVQLAAEWPWSSAHYRSQEGTSSKTLTHPTANRVPDKL